MTALEALQAAEADGITLALDAQARLVATPPGRLSAEAKAAIRAHKDQLKAVIRLRAIHVAMGFSREDVLFIEHAMLAGNIREVRIAARAPQGVVA